jgi:hypothetical protein
MDIQIWYAIFSTAFGGVSGALSHVGEVSDSFMYDNIFAVLKMFSCKISSFSFNVDTYPWHVKSQIQINARSFQ